MCTQFVPLAQSNDFRYVLQCEHGTIHLTWDLVTVYLNLSEFQSLARLLKKGTRLVEPSKIAEKRCILVYNEQSYYQLWVQNIAINLKPVEFLILADMVRVALKGVQEKQDRPGYDTGSRAVSRVPADSLCFSHSFIFLKLRRGLMRCQQLTLVAQVGEHQYLAYCEHGSIHLGWYYGAFHLQWDDFRRIVRLLERSMETPDFTKLQGEGCSLIRQKNSCLQLWLGPAALFLGETELPKLIELVSAPSPPIPMWPNLWAWTSRPALRLSVYRPARS